MWGSTLEKRKIHLVSWKNVCKPKAEGGLGLRKAKDMNRALLAKVGWRLVNNNGGLWAQILRSNYKVGGVHDGSWNKPKSHWSSTWRSVGVGLREVVSRGVGWVLGNGRLIRFWEDRWLMERPLLEWISTPLSEEEKRKRVVDYWVEGSGWDMGKLGEFLPEIIVQRLHAVVINGAPGIDDKLSWMGTANGSFSVRSAYLILTGDGILMQCMASFHEKIWKVVAPERVRVFLCLVGKQVILTNVERRRRHMGETDVCQVCNGAIESVIHVLRDCPAMYGIWIRLVPAREQRKFFEQTLLEWLFDNLRSKSDPTRERWPTVFAMAVWWGWKWRCGNVFGERGKCRDRLRFIKDVAEEVWKVHLKAKEATRASERVERWVAWEKPSVNWVKVNTDGASRGNPGQATAGGVIRDGEGAWLFGFRLT